jgi:Mitochondrial carrier protein
MSLQCFRRRIDRLVAKLFWTTIITNLTLNFPFARSFSISLKYNHASLQRSHTMKTSWKEYRNASPKAHESLLPRIHIGRKALSSILYAESGALNPTPSSNTMVIPINVESSNQVSINESSAETIPFITDNEDIQIDQISAKSRDNSNSIIMKDKLIIGSATAALLVAFLGLLSAAGPGGWRYYLAGGVCAALSHAVATPIDVVKVSLQCHVYQYCCIKVNFFSLGCTTQF